MAGGGGGGYSFGGKLKDKHAHMLMQTFASVPLCVYVYISVGVM